MKKNDFILIGGILLITLVLFAVFIFGQKSSLDEDVVVAEVIVKIGVTEVGRYSLRTDGEYELNGGTNHLVIKDGKAWLSHADCPDKLCVEQGKVYRNGQVITCLPYDLTVTVYCSDKQEGDVDFVS